jgi:hypothetical protein
MYDPLTPTDLFNSTSRAGYVDFAYPLHRVSVDEQFREGEMHREYETVFHVSRLCIEVK